MYDNLPLGNSTMIRTLSFGLVLFVSLGSTVSVHADESPTEYYRIWRGFRDSRQSFQTFTLDLNQLFIPSTVALGKGKGLNGFLAALLPEQKSPLLPDEVDLAVYSDKQSYETIMDSPEGKQYGASQDKYFDLAQSDALTPEPYDGSNTPIEIEHAYLMRQKGGYHWQINRNLFSVFMRSSGISDSDYRDAVRATLNAWKTLIDLDSGKPIWQVQRAVILVAHDYVLLFQGAGIRAPLLGEASDKLRQGASYRLGYRAPESAGLKPGSGVDLTF